SAPTAAPEAAPVEASVDVSSAANPDPAWVETFDTGSWGRINHAWGNVQTGNGEVTLTGISGMMEFPGGPSAGDGYGYREFVANIEGSGPGPAIVLWPGSNVWPGPEIDIGEIKPDGSGQYAALHWKGETGGDEYVTVDIGDYRGQWATYGVNWLPDAVEFYVNGELKGRVTENVGRDFANGGEDVTSGWLSSIGYGPGDGRITVTEVRFTPYDGSSTPGQEPAPGPMPAPVPPPNDWSGPAPQPDAAPAPEVPPVA
ncbi:family 16 glycosylhydrolase, partial [Falsiroseomonas oryziterrae]|uniref:family 16 glycosylhydrolase n=1 Tax=Falsiroseomonas oryziterrae TaxID=2911368 RepID=UPI001F011007